jgi:hypothetical protein
LNDNVTKVRFLDAKAAAQDFDNPELLAIEQIAVAGAELVCRRLDARSFAYPIPLLVNLPYGTKVIDSTRTCSSYRSVKDKQPILIIASLAIYEDLTSAPRNELTRLQCS